MKTFAVIENNMVVNIIVGVEDEVVAANPTEYVEYTESNPARIGDDYINGEFIPQPQPQPEIELPPRRISLDEIRNALTLAEKIKWDNNKTDEITTVKIEFSIPLLVADAEPWLQLLVDSGSISQESIDKVLQ
jgi:hypothetical protein